ncbi:MAG: erythromycin esterase family protein [Gemmatimonadota bacterium]|nr:erythromycin esterase family protein [Gemmatimonadota bacterium]
MRFRPPGLRRCRSTAHPIQLAAAILGLAACGDAATTAVEAPPDPEPPPIPSEATAWIEANSHAFEGSHLSLPHSDLSFLPGIVGDARIVSLGENTHGTRDFFEMKARILRFLVEEMGFTAFAIEATWPEARRLDHYVRTGEGDAAELLSGLYFWTWNTESVLEMIEWMRAHNEAGGDVGFHGFDMQYPGMALHNVREYVAAVDSAQAGAVATRLDCLGRFANDPSGRFPSPRYGDQTEIHRANCGASLDAVQQMLMDGRETYEAASGEEAFAVALQSMRVAIQYHLMITGVRGRDESMAENTVWIDRQLGPGARMVLWAHNFHVSAQPGAQGSFLRRAYGDAMLIVGFSHEAGTFTAVHQRGSSYLGLASLTLGRPNPLSYEHYLSTAAAPRYVVDLRNRDTSSEGASWLTGPRGFRAIGCCYDPGASYRYWSQSPLLEWYDVLIHYESTRPTVVLPSRYPTSF